MKIRRVTATRVVGVDISLTGPAVCVASGAPHSKARVDSGITVESAVFRAGKELRGPERLSVVARAITDWLHSRGVLYPGVVFVQEGYAFSRQQAHSLGEIGGCVRRVIWEAGCNLIVPPPSTLKKFITGKGSGDKSVIIKHVYKHWGFDVDNDDQCDAFCCALVGLFDQRRELCNDVQREILTSKVDRYAGTGQTDWGEQRLKRARKRRAD